MQVAQSGGLTQRIVTEAEVLLDLWGEKSGLDTDAEDSILTITANFMELG